MRKIFFWLLAAAIITMTIPSCEKENTVPENPNSNSLIIKGEPGGLKSAGELEPGVYDEINGSLPGYSDDWYGTDAYSSSQSYGLYGSVQGTQAYHGGTGIDYLFSEVFDTETPTSGMIAECRVKIGSTSDSNRQVGLGVYNKTEGTVYGVDEDELDSGDLTSTSTWYYLSFNYYSALQYAITAMSAYGWDSSDDYGFGVHFIDCGTNSYIDNLAFGTVASTKVITGPSTVYNTLPAVFSIRFDPCDHYEWSLTGNGNWFSGDPTDSYAVRVVPKFPFTGTYIVGCRVRDNDELWSDWIYKTVNISI